MDYPIAWTVFAVAGVGTCAGVYGLTRHIPWPWLKILLRSLAPVWLLLPAPIQAVDGSYAPAFVVLIFEAAFQSDGNPWPAFNALTAATFMVVGLLSIFGAIHLYRARRG